MDPAESEPDNVIWLETVPAAKYRLVVSALEDKGEEVTALMKALTHSHRQIAAVNRELDDFLDTAADRQTVRKCLDFWRTKTDRPKARIDLATGRAKHVRWVCTHKDWGPRGFCIAVVGIMDDKWWVKRGKTDVEHIVGYNRGCYSEARFEEFLNRGRRVLRVER